MSLRCVLFNDDVTDGSCDLKEYCLIEHIEGILMLTVSYEFVMLCIVVWFYSES